MATIECKPAMCISRLVEFELLLELKFKQKNGTSPDSPFFKAASSLKQSLHEQYSLSVPVIYLYIRAYNYRELPCIVSKRGQ
jgi:hypothetical protein